MYKDTFFMHFQQMRICFSAYFNENIFIFS